jgi:hypothetical protein
MPGQGYAVVSIRHDLTGRVDVRGCRSWWSQKKPIKYDDKTSDTRYACINSRVQESYKNLVILLSVQESYKNLVILLKKMSNIRCACERSRVKKSYDICVPDQRAL